jgi:uroporphyrin-3 C-methyltransferase
MTTDSSDASGVPLRATAPVAEGGDAGARPARVEASRGPAGGPVAWWVLGLAVALAAGAVWFVQDRLARGERDLVRRLQATELREQQTAQQVKLLGDTVREAQGKVAVLEAKIADSLGQQAQLRQLYDEMARSRGDVMLSDVENSLMIAAQQLQLAGNVQSALLALQDADQVLARSNQPAMLGLRRVISRDLERLKAVPLADFTAAVNRLDAVVAMIDQMPLMADVLPAAPAAIPERSAGGEPPEGLLGLPERFARTGMQGWEAFLAELRSLFRVQRVDRSEALLLSVEQRFVARESLRLQLLNARLNLLARNETLFHGDLSRATTAIEKWFDGSHRTVVAAQGALRQLLATRLSLELPSLSDSLAAVRAARASSDAATESR